MNTPATNTLNSDEDCEPAVELKRLLGCEASAIKVVLVTLLTTDDAGAVRREWQEQGVVKASLLRGYLNGRLPYRGMRSLDRSLRLSKVTELLIGDAIVSPLSATEAINQLGEFTRNKGSFLRLLPQGLNKLARIAGEPVEPVPLGFSAPSATAAE